MARLSYFRIVRTANLRVRGGTLNGSPIVLILDCAALDSNVRRTQVEPIRVMSEVVDVTSRVVNGYAGDDGGIGGPDGDSLGGRVEDREILEGAVALQPVRDPR